MKRLNLTFDTKNHLEYDLLYNKVDIKGWLDKLVTCNEYYYGTNTIIDLTYGMHFRNIRYFKKWDESPTLRKVPQHKFYVLNGVSGFVMRYPNKGVFHFGKNV